MLQPCFSHELAAMLQTGSPLYRGPGEEAARKRAPNPGPKSYPNEGTETMSSEGRGGAAWQRLLKQVYAEETHCYRCGLFVDQTIADRIPHGDSYRRNPQAKSGDHIWPYKDYPHLRLERSNVRLAHLFCNIQAGNKNPPARPQTKQW